jgi:tRNA pseudouridine synthase D (TruD)
MWWGAKRYLQSNDMDIRYVENVNWMLRKGDLVGNKFEIILRNIKRIELFVDPDNDHGHYKERFVPLCDGEQHGIQHLDDMVSRVQKYGFVNFYGEQRVGEPGHETIAGVRAFDIGRAILQGNYMKAIDLILTGRRLINGEVVTTTNKDILDCSKGKKDDEGVDCDESINITDTPIQQPDAVFDVERKTDVLPCPNKGHDEDTNLDRFRQEWVRNGGNVDRTLKIISRAPASLFPRERLVLKGLKRYGKDNPLAALRCLQHGDRVFYVNAVSFVSVLHLYFILQTS